MTEPSALLEAAQALEREHQHQKTLADAADAQASETAELRQRIRSAINGAEQEHARRTRAINRYNQEVEHLAKYGKRALALARSATPVAVPIPPQVRMVVKGRVEIASAVALQSKPFNVGPSSCGIYFLVEGSEVVYVGQSIDVFMRILTHRKEGYKPFDKCCWFPLPKDELDSIESALIALLKPRHNRAGVTEIGEESLEITCV